MNIKPNLLIPLIFVLIGLISTTILAQTPPVIYVATDGTGDFNCNGASDQVEINQALDYVVANSEFTTVYLKGDNTFIIDEPVLISSNTILTGDPSAKIQLKNNTGWWTQDKPMITQSGRIEWHSLGITGESISNVEIYGFTINGGMFQEEPSGNRYNTLIHFTFPNNISIHDMHFKNGQWDAVRLSSSTFSHINCEVFNNDIYACGHDAISFVGVVNCNAHHNKIYKTRTNSGLRATHCDSIYFHNNIIANSISLPPSGYAGIQIQNTEIEYPCTYAEIYENVIYGKSEGIHLGEESNSSTYPTGTMKNVHIHHNKIYKTNTVSAGGGIILTGGIVVMGYQNTIIEHNIVDGSVTDGISFRGNAGGGNGYQTIVRNNIIINNQGFGINNEDPTINTFISNNNLVYNNEVGNYNNTTSSDDIDSNPLFGTPHSTLNQWHHIVASYDNATETMKIYIDGVEKSNVSHPDLFGTIGTNSYNLLLGAIYNSNYWFKGSQDEFAIWNRALTTDEVIDLYNEGKPINITGSLTSGLQAYFEMENNWNDTSGNGFNAEDSSAVFTTDAINGDYAGSFNGVDEGVLYPTNLSTANGITISVWTYRTSLDEEIQTIVNKGRMDDFNHIWLYFRGESVMFELGNGTIREDLEAYITNPEDLDYHLKSEYGRWDDSVWVNDMETSPCIDTGDPTTDYSNEPVPNGNRANIGVYGNTAEASKSTETAGIKNYNISNILIYPNPTSGKIYFLNQNSNNTYQIFSITGSIVKKGEIKNNFIDLSKLKKGIYFIKVIDIKTDNKSVFKILKE